MKLSINWLQDSLDFDHSPEELVTLITSRIAEVEALHVVGATVLQAKVGIITELRPHPTNQKLQIATIALQGAKAEVVSGAPNLSVGLATAYLAPGAEITTDDGIVKVAAKEIGGVTSQGLIASEKELGIGPDQSGVIDLGAFFPESKLVAGRALSEVVGGVDHVIEIENKSLTHRPDLWSHHGFAADLAAVLNIPVKRDPHKFSDVTKSGAELLKILSGSGRSTMSDIEIDPKTQVRRFTLLEIANVTDSPSPMWMRRRLTAIGAGVRGLLVDLSNYVLHDVGAPNHVFDLSKIKGDKFYVRYAKKGEHLLCLDGVDRQLDEDDIIVADSAAPLSLGGIIGGTPSSVQDGTRNILLECANWDPVGIRRVARKQQVRTDASNRFEKNLSPYLAVLGQHRYVDLLCDLSPEATIVGNLLDVFPIKPTAKKIAVSLPYFSERMGVDVESKQVVSTLKALRCEVEVQGETLLVEPAYDRAMADLTRPEDLLEEVARCYGIENIPATPPSGGVRPVVRDKLWNLEHTLRDFLRANGFSECFNYSFMSSERGREFGFDGAIKILNPIDKTQDAMRNSLIPGLVEAVDRNLRQDELVPLFEVGRTYYKREGEKPQHEPSSREGRRVAVAIGGAEVGTGEFYGLLGLMRRIIALVSDERCEFRRTASGVATDPEDFKVSRSWQHPHRAAYVSVGDSVIGVVAEVESELLNIRQRKLVIAELDIAALLSLDVSTRKYKPFGKFPESFFEISAVVPKKLEFGRLEELLAKSVSENLLRRVEFLDQYEGPQIAADEKSVSVRLVFGSNERTLSGEEIRALQEAVISEVQSGGYRLRTV